MESSKPLISLFWFRRDLRLEDNRGLFESLNGNHPVLPIFIFDKNILDELEDKKDARVTFIHKQIVEIHKKLKSKSSTVLVHYGDPVDIFRTILNTYNIASVYTNHDYEPYAKTRDTAVENLLNDNNIQFFTFKDQVIFEKSEILSGSGEPYKVYTAYKNAWLNKLTSNDYANFSSALKSKNFLTTEPSELPTLRALGFETSEIALPDLTLDEEILRTYDKTRDNPSLPTSRIGLHLRFGTISVREAVDFARQNNQVWLEELIWREFFMMILFHNPQVVDKAYKPKYDKIVWRNNESEFKKWCEGKTGYPIVDAGMRELNATGFMHNRVRMVTASFLTKHLLVDWRWGEAYFAKKLLDYELSSNNGNWQWVAGTGADAQPYFRVFNPTSQMVKFDKDLKYIKKWVPEFGTFDYPNPMVPHREARERALSVFKEAIS